MKAQASNPQTTPKYRQTERYFKSNYGIGTAYYRVRTTDILRIWVNNESKEVKYLLFDSFSEEKSLDNVIVNYGYSKETEITKKEFTAVLQLIKTIF